MLRPALIEIKKRVDDFYKGGVPCSIVAPFPLSGVVVRGGLKTDNLGHASIVLVQGETVNETILAHELMHAELDVEGYPTTVPTRFEGYFPPEHAHDIVDLMRDTLQHEIIFPRMVAIGFDPQREEREETQAYLDQDLIPSTWVRQQILPIQIIETVRDLELEEPLRSRNMALLRRHGFSYVVSRALALKRMMDSSEPIRPGSFDEVTDRCLLLVASSKPMA